MESAKIWENKTVEKEEEKVLKAAKRAKSRIVAKATHLSNEDIVQILCLKNEQEQVKQRSRAAR